MKWDNLTMSQKQALMKIYVNNGVTNLDEIVNHYNRFAEGGPIENIELPKTNDRPLLHGHTSYIDSSSTPNERLNLRPAPGLLTDANVGAGVNFPFKELIDRFVLEKINTSNIIDTDSINRSISYITRPSRINRFDEGGYKSQSDNTRVQMPRTDVEPIYYEPAAVAANAVSKQPQSGALTPVYPEFELLMGLRAAAIGAAKGVKAASKVSSKAPSKAVKINNKITADNLADITDEMWDDAYNAAIANNDLVEAQRLRDLHFKAKAPNTKVVDSNGNPVKTYHGNMTGDQHYRSQRLNPYSTTRSSRVSSGYFSSSSEKIADSYHITPDAKTHQVYLNYEDPLIIDAQGAHYSTVGTDRVVNKAFSQGKDGVIIKNVEDAGIGRISGPVVGEDRIADDFISTAGRAKSSDAVTKRVDIFTGEDEIIPLSERDNFLNPDIRYILAPAFMTGTGYGIYNTTNNTSTHKYGGKLKKNKK